MRNTLGVALAALALVLGGYWFFVEQEPPRVLPSRGLQTLHAEGPKAAAPPSVEERLVAANWDPGAAHAVAALNADWFAAINADDAALGESFVQSLEHLGRHRGVMPALRRNPELAGLLADESQPETLVRLLDVPERTRAVYLGLFLLNPGHQERADLVAALRAHGPLIVRLHDAGLPGTEALFIYPRTHEGDLVYDRWLRENLETRLRGSEEDVASFLQLVQEHGPGLRLRLREAPEFRRRFRDELWPALERVSREPGNALEMYLDDTGVWDVLARPGGEELLRRRGMLAVALLFGPQAYPPELHNRVASILLAGDGDTFVGLTEGKFRNAPLFRTLLATPLPDGLMAQVVASLLAAGARYDTKLAEYATLKDNQSALAEKLGPKKLSVFEWIPFYSHLAIAWKLAAQETIEDDEWVALAVDTVASLVPIGPRGPVVKQSLKGAAGKTAVKKLGANAAGQMMRQVGRRATTQLARQQAKRGLYRWGLSGLLREIQAASRAVARHLTLDVTRLTQTLYKRSGLGRWGFRKLTRLEPQVFMRRDAGVFIRLDRLALKKACAFLQNTALTAVAGQLKSRPTAAEARHLQRKNASAILFLQTGDQRGLRSVPSGRNP